MICAANAFCRNSDCILDAKLPCNILCIAHIVQAHVFFLTSLLSPHRDVYNYVDGVNDDDDVFSDLFDESTH